MKRRRRGEAQIRFEKSRGASRGEEMGEKGEKRSGSDEARNKAAGCRQNITFLYPNLTLVPVGLVKRVKPECEEE